MLSSIVIFSPSIDMRVVIAKLIIYIPVIYYPPNKVSIFRSYCISYHMPEFLTPLPQLDVISEY